MSCFEGQKKNNLSSNNIDPTRLILQYTDSTLHIMNGSSSSASSDDENYYSATEFASPEKKSNEATVEALATSLKALNEASHQAMDYVNRCASIEPPTDKELECMAFLEENVKGKLLEDDTDFLDRTTYLRFARARDGKKEKALSMLESCIAWRRQYKPHQITAANAQLSPE